MVLFKRKPVLLIPNPTDIPDNTDVFVMKGTGEVFADYEKYLKRYDYLSQKKFTDAVNGKSNLTYFDALESENKSSNAIENIFPEVLKDPILRRVQFATISRIDDLVNTVFDEFKRDFFPGEIVTVTLEQGDQSLGIIREKAKFPMIRGPDGTVQRHAFSRYFVRLRNTNEEEVLSDDAHIRRDKKMFTKQNLRAYLKNSLQREGWIGAPWLVKEDFAIQYRLPMEIPAHLLQDAKLLANRVLPTMYDLHCEHLADPMQQQQMLAKQAKNGRRPKGPGDLPGPPIPQPNGTPQNNVGERLPFQSARKTYKLTQMSAGAQARLPDFYAQQQQAALQRPPPPPPVKYPIEDLDLAPKRNGVARPELKFFNEEMSEYIKSNRRTTFDGIDMDSLGMLLEVWNTLNVQCEVYVLDSFTFDDFVDAMQYAEPEPECELLNEAHCAVLKVLVDDKGKILVKTGLPRLPNVEEEQESEEEDSQESTPQPDVPARSTRSRLSHVENVDNQKPSTMDKLHRAAEIAGGEYGWEKRLAARDMEDGGWQMILAGLLYQLSFSPIFKERCDKILTELVPLDMEPTPENIRDQYRTLHISLRISALQIITVLSISSDSIRSFLDACADDMTDVRKRKIEYQREKKAAFEELQIKDREYKILLPANMPESPKAESVERASTISEIEDTIDVNGPGSPVDSDEDMAPTRALRRGNDRKRKRDEEAARVEKQKAEKAAAAKAQSKQTKEFKKLSSEIQKLKDKIVECEDKIVDCDADLREANVQRTKILGMDRFFNRYYWYERNGQPFGGLPNSSTASYGYANGRIWVQGPDPQEIGPYEDDEQFQKDYRNHFHMTVKERRKQEEGPTILQNSREWGFYDDPDRLDNLIGWLDDRGNRERKLRKDLVEWRDTIAKYMDAYKSFNEEEAARKLADSDDEQPTRITTRHQQAVEQVEARERCLKWRNTMVLEAEGQGHLHSQNPRKKKEKKKAPKGTAVLVNRQGKPLTRQGTSHR